jgi:hypothetical protein
MTLSPLWVIVVLLMIIAVLLLLVIVTIETQHAHARRMTTALALDLARKLDELRLPPSSEPERSDRWTSRQRAEEPHNGVPGDAVQKQSQRQTPVHPDPARLPETRP